MATTRSCKGDGGDGEDEVITTEADLTQKELDTFFLKVPFNPDFQLPTSERFEVNPHNPQLMRIRMRKLTGHFPHADNYKPKRKISIKKRKAMEENEKGDEEEEEKRGELEEDMYKNAKIKRLTISLVRCDAAAKTSEKPKTSTMISPDPIPDPVNHHPTLEEEEDEDFRQAMDEVEKEDDPDYVPEEEEEEEEGDLEDELCQIANVKSLNISQVSCDEPSTSMISPEPIPDPVDQPRPTTEKKKKVQTKRPRKGPRKQLSGKRKRKECPDCNIEVVHLPRHLTIAHGYTKQAAKARVKGSNSKLKHCPIRGCNAIVKRLDTHMVVFHQKKRGDDLHQLVMSAKGAELIEEPAEAVMEEEGGSFSRGEWRKEKLLRNFKGWQMSLEKNRGEKIAEQHAQQIFSLWSTIDPDLDIQSLLSPSNIRDIWLPMARDKFAPGTVRSYLGSLKDFIDFLVDTGELEGTVATALTEKFKRWARALQIDIQKRRVEKRAEDDAERIEPEDIAEFQRSKIYTEAVEMFEDMEEDLGEGELQEENFLLARNFLMLNLLINNGQRVGALINLKVRHIKNAEKKDNNHVAVIAHHKTGYIAPITLVFSEELWKFMQIYLTKIRPRLPGFTSELEEERSAVFLTYPSKTASPSSLNPSSVNKAIKSIWKAADQTKSISATQLRKATATSVRSKYPLARDILAQQMNHRPSTQDAYYMLTQKKSDAVKIVRVIESVMRNVDEEVREIDGHEGPIIQEVDDIDKENTLPLPEGSLPAPQHKRRLFTTKEAAFILSTCKKLIDDDDKVIKGKTCVELLEKDEEGRKIIARVKDMYPTDYQKRIGDRVRAQRRLLSKK